MDGGTPARVRRRPEQSVLHRAVREGWPEVRAELEAEGELPARVHAEVGRSLACGDVRRGFLLAACDACADTALVAFSCKTRGWCPSCAARRGHEAATHLMEVLPHVAYRQWTLSLPFALRWPVVKVPTLLRGLERCLTRALFRSQRRAAKQLGHAGPLHGGAVSFVQFFSSTLGLQPHLHLLVPEGVFRGGTYVALPPPTQQTVEAVLKRMLRQARRAFAAHAEAWPEDAFEGLQRQGAQERLSLGDAAPDTPGRLVAVGEGFSLHAGTHVHARDRAALARLCRYGARGLAGPPHLLPWRVLLARRGACCRAACAARASRRWGPEDPGHEAPAQARLGHPARADLGRRRLALPLRRDPLRHGPRHPPPRRRGDSPEPRPPACSPSASPGARAPSARVAVAVDSRRSAPLRLPLSAFADQEAARRATRTRPAHAPFSPSPAAAFFGPIPFGGSFFLTVPLMLDASSDLAIATVDAIRKSLRAISAAHPTEHLSGYALCTDDSVMTIFPVACTREQIEQRSDIPDVEWVATDWPYYEGVGAFDGVLKMVQARYAEAVAAQAFDRHVAETFAAFVVALRRCREDGLFASDTLLSVLSTDPGPLLQQMECQATQALNPPRLFEAWRAKMGYPPPPAP